ncbi:hypothetical protein E3Q18_00312 [Wallemia mellicola]|uniref:Uncharacterized protein n=1 Tax=Wallemia mellicola TaxID=1708541 RepID=A0A4T0NX74_9BASI|nr:hypothetical protein E3Q19_00298 [Wallemia mellicola]TIC02224.1 hypothetical protein E3Q18_00312 [Wallemia mellicola]TIC29006.1 hypothetical protein E3Q11_01622 [Wallemia mellicola]TIC33695.1 hypothetical protein E3Q10_00710 [Wallemia mellicola]TIC74165.1 hypothetical protein E3Q00_02222 [Wallemia mellicola]
MDICVITKAGKMNRYIDLIISNLEVKPFKKEAIKVTSLKQGVSLEQSNALSAKLISVVEVAKRNFKPVHQYTRLVEHPQVRKTLSVTEILEGKRLAYLVRLGNSNALYSQMISPPATIEVILSSQPLALDESEGYS